jgi:hypothetical protein
MSSGRDLPDSEPWLTFEDLSNPLGLSLQCPALGDSEPAEGLNCDLDPLAGSTLVPDASNHAIDHQYWIVASLA